MYTQNHDFELPLDNSSILLMRNLLGFSHEQLARHSSVRKSQIIHAERRDTQKDGISLAQHTLSARNKRQLRGTFAKAGFKSEEGRNKQTIISFRGEIIMNDGEPVEWLKSLLSMAPGEFRDLRHQTQLSRREIAEISGVFNWTISAVEGNTSFPTFLRHKIALKRAYDLELREHSSIPDVFEYRSRL